MGVNNKYRGFTFLCLSAILVTGTAAAETRSGLKKVDLPAMRLAIQDLMATYPEEFSGGHAYLQRLETCEQRLPALRQALAENDPAALREAEEIVAFQREVLLSNPLLDFERLLLIKRRPLGDPRRATDMDKGVGKYIGLPQQSSWQLHTMPNVDVWENEIAVLSPVRPDGELTTLYEPPDRELLTHMDLHFDAGRVMFSMPNEDRFWQVYEIGADGGNLRQVSSKSEPDVHNFDACYLPNGKIAFISTAMFQGVPCNASVNVGMTYLMDADGSNIRQICFEQDHNFCPTVMNDGRILYLRWEYTDIPHVWARFLFTMNPDGTGQREFYGSGGYWPNAIFYARPIPNHPTKIAGIVTGHHVGRIGELMIFDPALGRKSTEGVVQRIPGRGKKVEPLIQDKLTLDSWPKFVHPYPLSEKYFLVSAKLSPDDLWGIYLVDVFDNMVLVKELEDFALVEPIPLRMVQTPPVIPDTANLSRKDAVVYLSNVYAGPGLEGVPHGSVKKLRLYTYHFAYRTVAGINHRVGADGPWEPKRILGTVPVEKDGSALFRVPANTPISIQPLDADGRALQLMRSWMTAMPGEYVSCTGCHERQNDAPANHATIAAVRQPSEIEPWRGPARGFSFKREVQPVLDKYCVSCHDGIERTDGTRLVDLRDTGDRFVVYRNGDPRAAIVRGVPASELCKEYGGVFQPSYIELRRRVRVGGLESDLRLLEPGEFHASNSELVQMLEKGHHGVKLDEEAWDRITAWIDLNAPCHGTWNEVVGQEKTSRDRLRRRDLLSVYAGIDEDPEAESGLPGDRVQPVAAESAPEAAIEPVECSEWPFDADEAKRLQAQSGKIGRTLDLGDGLKLALVMVPAGRFVMGDLNGQADERPPTVVEIEKPFWIGKLEVTNEQYARFDPSHDSRYEHKGSWMFNEWDLGWDLNRPDQPVVRVSQEKAVAFCAWLSEKTGEKVMLPTEAQWEYACRAGTGGALSYGDLDADFSQYGNMADVTIRGLAYHVRDQNPPDLVPRDSRYNDLALVSAGIGGYKPNAWGLHDMHGNVWEWTRSSYAPYPYDAEDGRNDPDFEGDKVVRGGSWYDRPKRCRSAFRLSYPAWRKTYNVGFRVVVETEGGTKVTLDTD